MTTADETGSGAKPRTACLFLLLSFIFLLLPAALMADVACPLGEFPFSSDYEFAFQRAVSSGSLDLVPSVGPYYHSDLSRLFKGQTLSPAMNLIGPVPEGDCRLFSIISQGFLAKQGERGQDVFSLAGGVRYQLSKHFGALILFNLDRRKALDPDYSGKKWRGLAGDVETAAIYFKKGNLGLTLGRQRVFWGPQPINLLLSETAEPLDLFSATYRKGKLRFNFLFARLDGSRPDTVDIARFPDRTFRDNRYLVGHRLDISFGKGFRLGLFETSLFGGEGRSPELYYLNPLQPFHTAQLNEGEDDNTILGLDFTYFPGWQSCIYGQLLIDDFQIDRSSQGDQEPDEIGLMVGLYRAGKAKSLTPDIKLEYTRITNRTYHQRNPRNRYLYRNKLLGHPLGPDADSLSFMVRFWPGVGQQVKLELAYRRHGEGSIYGPWTEPWFDVEDDYDESFPSGVVEKSLFVAAGVKGYLPFFKYVSDHVYVSIDAGYGAIRNAGNTGGKDSSERWLNLSLSWLGFLEVGLND